MLVFCAFAAFGAYGMANSWWVEDAPTASADQQLPDGQSRFDQAGLGFLNRQGLATVDVVDAASASELGLPSSGDTPVETLVPLPVDVRGSEGVVSFPGVSWFALATEHGKLTTLTLTPASSTTWVAIRSELEQRAVQWGWSESDLRDLQQKVGDAGREEGVAQTFRLPTTLVDGMNVTAEVSVDEGGRIALRYVFAR